MDKKGKIATVTALIVAAFAVAYFVMAGSIPRYSCSDTDGGNVITIFGTVSGYDNKIPYTYDDACVDSGNINEYYCNGLYAAQQQQSCGTDGYVGSNYCLNGNVYRDYQDYYCGSGACASSTTVMLQQTCEPGQYCSAGACYWNNTCSDTDGGYNPVLQGTASGVLQGVQYSNTDFCADSTSLVEYYCSGSIMYSANMTCSGNVTQCSQGACI